jgi:ribosomal RNA methyltransferase Nop2
MGRRAKNKQGDPPPLDESVFLKRLAKSKRKADDDDSEHVAKKSKKAPNPQRTQTRSPAKKAKTKNGKEGNTLKSVKKGKKKAQEGDEDEWEGLGGEEDEELDAQRQYYHSVPHAIPGLTAHPRLLFDGSDGDEAMGFEGDLNDWISDAEE